VEPFTLPTLFEGKRVTDDLLANAPEPGLQPATGLITPKIMRDVDDDRLRHGGPPDAAAIW
jgi:hypothetical protein